MTGGVSHVDTFDPKPKLFADHGKTDHRRQLAGQARQVQALPQKAALGRSSRGGKSGIEVSDLFPHVARRASTTCASSARWSRTTPTTTKATLGMHTGSFTFARPSIGAWVSYGLGTENRNLPSFMVSPRPLPTPATRPGAPTSCPAAIRGRTSCPARRRSPNVRAARRLRRTCRSWSCDLIAEANRRHLERRPGDAGLEARIRSFETAFGMQRQAPEAFDLSQRDRRRR